ncbi:hypothetical protein P3T76_003238 [Phytophthora citrophthora]|uniref:RxLR effector protein n=1 Tax=Phytophthora citrophthora TaxID=4793 RepID=A0AAD9LPG8_9STRA|nr:hypothetical protein P3T76_003238 [Phytophthora citrophthora]
MRAAWFMSAIALAFAFPITAQSTATTLAYMSPSSEDTTAAAGVQPGSTFRGAAFVNEQVTATSPPDEDFHNTALSAAGENGIVGTAESYTDTTTTLSAATTAEKSTEDDSTGASVVTTTPVLLAAAAACIVAIGAIAIVKKRANMRVPSPHTPVDKAIYYQANVPTTMKKPGYFHVNRQLTPPEVVSYL